MNQTTRNGPDVRRHFDAKADSYYGHYYLEGKLNCHVHNQQVRRELFAKFITHRKPSAEGRALDIGSGPGSIAIDLVRHNWETFCVDIAFNMLVNNKKNTNNEVSVAQCSMESLAFADNSFDIITAAGVLEYLPNDDNALCEVFRVLKPGGLLIISVPIGRFLTLRLKASIMRWLLGRKSNPVSMKAYTPKGFSRALEEHGLSIVTSRSHHFVFFPLDYLFPAISIRLDGVLTKLLGGQIMFGRLGKTFIACAQRSGQP